MSEEAYEVWVDCLAGFKPQEVEQAFDTAFKTCKYAPKPAEIRSLILDRREERKKHDSMPQMVDGEPTYKCQYCLDGGVTMVEYNGEEMGVYCGCQAGNNVSLFDWFDNHNYVWDAKRRLFRSAGWIGDRMVM